MSLTSVLETGTSVFSLSAIVCASLATTGCASDVVLVSLISGVVVSLFKVSDTALVSVASVFSVVAVSFSTGATVSDWTVLSLFSSVVTGATALVTSADLVLSVLVASVLESLEVGVATCSVGATVVSAA